MNNYATKKYFYISLCTAVLSVVLVILLSLKDAVIIRLPYIPLPEMFYRECPEICAQPDLISSSLSVIPVISIISLVLLLVFEYLNGFLNKKRLALQTVIIIVFIILSLYLSHAMPHWLSPYWGYLYK